MNLLRDYARLYAWWAENTAECWLQPLQESVAQALSMQHNRCLSDWLDALARLPRASTRHFQCGAEGLQVGEPCSATEQAALEETLRTFHPWRKGPLTINGVFVDTEWRSDWKWQRLQNHIAPLNGRTVLDVGCGNGYHCWRMLAEGAERVVGIDPTLLFVMQFFITKHFAGDQPVWVLPLGIESLSSGKMQFDSVFSMGVLYHRRSPIDHLIDLKRLLKPGGELLLETLIDEGPLGHTLIPRDRYAQMRNVWFLPSVDTLCHWLDRCGFDYVRCVDVTQTTGLEQRRTRWMMFQSLADFLDPKDPNKTVEGYPAPKRAIFIANKCAT